MVNSLTELISQTELDKIEDPEERFITNGVDWHLYEILLTKLSDNSHYRVAYLDGILEILSPSFRHYEQMTASELLPQLNISLLEECTLISDQIEAIQEFERDMQLLL
jgi:hypothetical protein